MRAEADERSRQAEREHALAASHRRQADEIDPDTDAKASVDS
ncbi:MAG: hypothetical protein ACXVYV_05555 [Gaiellales bacterium]